MHGGSNVIICPASFYETWQWLKRPLNGLRAQGRVSPVVGLLRLASAQACLGMAFPPFLVKQLYRCDSVVMSSFVRTGYTARRWGCLLGRIGFSFARHFSPTGRRNHGRHLKRFLGTSGRNGSTSGPTSWQVYYYYYYYYYSIMIRAELSVACHRTELRTRHLGCPVSMQEVMLWCCSCVKYSLFMIYLRWW
jgi:hypothetical protein